MNTIIKPIALFLFTIPTFAWGQQVPGPPNPTIEGTAASFNLGNFSGLGVTGIISNTNNTMCIIYKIEVQWGKVNTSNNNAFTAYSSFFTTTIFTIQPAVVTPNIKWNYSTASQPNTLFNNSNWTLGGNEKHAANVTMYYMYYVSDDIVPKTGKFNKIIIK